MLSIVLTAKWDRKVVANFLCKIEKQKIIPTFHTHLLLSKWVSMLEKICF